MAMAIDGEDDTMSYGTVNSTQVEGTGERLRTKNLPVSSGSPTNPSVHPYYAEVSKAKRLSAFERMQGADGRVL